MLVYLKTILFTVLRDSIQKQRTTTDESVPLEFHWEFSRVVTDRLTDGQTDRRTDAFFKKRPVDP
jgi:hypothetical protein